MGLGGDGTVHTSNQNTFRKSYREPGDFTLQVTQLDGEQAAAVGTADVAVAYPYTIMDLMGMTTDVSVWVCGYGGTDW